MIRNGERLQRDKGPAATPASVANDIGVPTETGYFCAEIAMEIAVRHGRAYLVVANNVLPHVPDLFDFSAGFAGILRPNGVLVLVRGRSAASLLPVRCMYAPTVRSSVPVGPSKTKLPASTKAP